MARKLKVFQSRFGFHDAVVAVPSQAAALRAWGTTQNLFAEKQAWVATDPHAIEAALAQPELVLRRAVGTEDPFSLKPRLPRAADLPDVAAARPRAGAPVGTPPKAPRKPPPDRAPLAAAEAALRRLDEAHAAKEEDFERRRHAIEQECAAARAAHRAARTKAEAAVRRAVEAFRAAGGVDAGAG